MRTDRRTFIRTGAIALAGTAMINNSLFGANKKKAITGLQLYSIRDDMSLDPLGSLTKLAAMGYKYIEHANYVDRKFYGYSVTELKGILNDVGLKMISGHTVMEKRHWDNDKKTFTDSWKYTVDDAASLGQQFVISSWIDESLRQSNDEFRHWMDIFNECGELCRKNGMKFGYHNHNFEFSEKLNDEKLFDIIMRNIDPELVLVQLDIGNIYGGGAVASEIVSQYPGRFENVHVKDVFKTGSEQQYESTIIGEGVAEVRTVLEQLTNTGSGQVIIIEQESYQGKTPMECAKINLDIIREWGY